MVDRRGMPVDGILHVTGRDVDEAEYALRSRSPLKRRGMLFDQRCIDLWVIGIR